MSPVTGPPYRRMSAAALKIAGLVVLLIAVNHGVSQVLDWLDLDIRPSNESMVHRTIMLAAVIYTLALAIPFVPGVEIGLGLIALLGVKIVPLVYICTVSGLMLAYLAGRLVRPRVLAGLARDLHLRRISALLAEFDRMPPGDALAFLLASSPGGVSRFLLRYRYVAIALAFNLPGNFLIGGGGGIAMLAGISRLFSLPLFILTMAIAVAPVPVAIHFFGPQIQAR